MDGAYGWHINRPFEGQSLEVPLADNKSKPKFDWIIEGASERITQRVLRYPHLLFILQSRDFANFQGSLKNFPRRKAIDRSERPQPGMSDRLDRGCLAAAEETAKQCQGSRSRSRCVDKSAACQWQWCHASCLPSIGQPS